MKPLTLLLESAGHSERIEGVSSFVGEDASGSFGILPGHEFFVTVLDFGLSSFRVAGSAWRYLAAPGAVLRVHDDELHFATRRYVLGDDYETIRDALIRQISVEERALADVKTSLRGLEQEMLKRLWQLARHDGAAA
jgi:F-type H+-transporting ATPase subunit epsilon